MAVLRYGGAIFLLCTLLVGIADFAQFARNGNFGVRYLISMDSLLNAHVIRSVLTPAFGESVQIQIPSAVSTAPAIFVFGALALILFVLSVIGRKTLQPDAKAVQRGTAANNNVESVEIKQRNNRQDAMDLEFLPAALELLETPPAPHRLTAMLFVCIAFSTALAWAYFGFLDIHAIAPGRIQPNGRSKFVQPLDPGKIVQIVVENGSKVKTGDILLELDPTETGADREAQVRELESTRAEAERRRTAISSIKAGGFDPLPIAFAADIGEQTRRREISLISSELSQVAASCASLRADHAVQLATRDRLAASIGVRERLLALTKERVTMRKTLDDRGSLSRALVIDSLVLYETQMTTQVGEQGQLAEIVATLEKIERKIEETTVQFLNEQTQKLSDAERKLDKLQQELVKAHSKNERVTLRAPISGTVQQLAVTTVGQVVTTGQSLMTIVPLGGELEIEAMIQNLDIGFVETGQLAVVKIESFPFTRYGTIDGTVIKVSRDAVDEREANALNDPGSSSKTQSLTTASSPSKAQSLVFPATIQLSRRSINVDGKEIPLSPGMAVTVEIRTGERRAIDYLLSPLREITGNTAHER